MTDTQKMKEELSALLDGELDPARLDEVLAAIERQPELLDEVQIWQGAGDQMRQSGPVSASFMRRFSDRLAAEPVLLHSRRKSPHSLRRVLLPLSLAASVSFIAFTAWQGLQGGDDTQVIAKEDRVVRPYLAAHLEDADNPLAEGGMIKTAFVPGENR